METIKNYLEGMFAVMPNTESVLKAKDELLQMMEDKYNELISEGVSENAAVGQVISEFGNLDELAESLGLVKEVTTVNKAVADVPRRNVSLDEVKEYITKKAEVAFRTGLGVLFCICCVCPVILADEINLPEWSGIALMFIMIAVGVALFIMNGVLFEDYKYIENQPIMLDVMTTQYVSDEKKNYKSTHAIRLTIGVILCVLCWLPCACASSLNLVEDLMAIFLFVLVGIGVFMIVYTNIINGAYERLLKSNDRRTVSGHYADQDNIEYINPGVKLMMEVFWPTVTCLYLAWSFITFDWWCTWIVWPIAAIIHAVLKNTLRKDN